MPRRVRILALSVPSAIAGAAIVAGFPALGAPARSSAVRAHASATGKPYSATLSYIETNHGHQSGKTTIGVQGHGSFSAKLGAHAQLDAALIALATGVPVSKIAQGGRYTVERKFLADGSVSGIGVGKFKARGLGSLCVSYTQHQGTFNQSQGFVPMFGTVKTVGGTGAAAKWRISLSYKQTGVSGISVEQLTYGGSEHASVGTARPMSAACKRVAAIK